jgi:hypothetical protein
MLKNIVAWPYYLRFELLVYRGMYMYKNLKNLSSWLHEELIDDNEPIGVGIFRAEFN